MIRNLKALGLAVVAVLAMSVVVASAAQAAEFTSFNTTTNEHEGGTVSGSQEGTHEFTPGAGFGAVKCTTANFSGSSSTGTDETLTITPEYAGCTAFSTLTAHVRLNGCDYHFSITGTISENSEYEGATEVRCPEGKVIEVEVTKSGGGLKCLDTIGPQSGIGPIIYKQSGSQVLVESKANNVVNTTSGGALNCGIGNGTHTEGTYFGNVKMTAKNSGGTVIDAMVRG